MLTIKDIARECGVSANTVSSVLNNKPGEASEKTRARVLEAMHRLNYRPNAAARRMVGKRMNTIGIADRYSDTSVSDPYKSQILEPLVHEARSRCWDILYYSGHSSQNLAGGFPAFLDGRSDGLLCFTGSIADGEVEVIVRSGLPVVFVGEVHGNRGGSVIDVDNEAGARLAVDHLIQLGHTRIGMMQGIGIAGNQERVDGWRKSLEESGMPVDDSLLCESLAWEEDGYLKGVGLLSRQPSERPTAIFCFNDILAFGVLRAAATCGLRVPDDISIVGFDDVINSALTVPPLTTVRQPLAWIGQRAVEILIAIIEGKIPRNHREIVAPELIIRASTAAPSQPRV